jgi:hypothetical protein
MLGQYLHILCYDSRNSFVNKIKSKFSFSLEPVYDMMRPCNSATVA